MLPWYVMLDPPNGNWISSLPCAIASGAMNQSVVDGARDNSTNELAVLMMCNVHPHQLII